MLAVGTRCSRCSGVSIAGLQGMSCVLSRYMAVHLRAMIGKGRAADSQGEAIRPVLYSWPGYGDLHYVTGRLSRSATIALLLSPVGLLLISVSRLLIISDYNPVTASAIASSGGYIDTVLGTIIPIVPILLPYLALLLLFFGRVILGTLTVLMVALVSPMTMSRPNALKLAKLDWRWVIHAHAPLTVIMILLAVPFACLLFIELAGRGLGVFIKTAATIACIVLVPFVSQLYPLPLNNNFYTQLIRQPWLPAETITLSSGREFTGYILSDSGSWLIVLKNANRSIHYYRASYVVKRHVCRIGQASLRQPFIALASAKAHALSPARPCAASSASRPSSNEPSGPAIHVNRHKLRGLAPSVYGSAVLPIRPRADPRAARHEDERRNIIESRSRPPAHRKAPGDARRLSAADIARPFGWLLRK